MENWGPSVGGALVRGGGMVGGRGGFGNGRWEADGSGAGDGGFERGVERG